MGRVKRCVVALSGKIGSGKSFVSNALADSLGFPATSFGDYVRSVVKSRGLDDRSREVCQEVGESLIASGWPMFCREVLASIDWQPGGSFIIEGVRHVEALSHLRAIVAPVPIVHVHIDIEESERRERLISRDGARSGERVESHSTEGEVGNLLPRVADLIVNGSDPVGNLVAEIMEFTCTRCHSSTSQ